MLYICGFILINLVFISILIYNTVIKNQNEIDKQNAIEFNEPHSPKTLLKPIKFSTIVWLNVGVLFTIFIISRFFLIGKSTDEYINQPVKITSNYIQTDGHNYLLYVDGELLKIPLSSVKIVVGNTSTPYLKNYKSRHIKHAIPNHNLFFLFNRKEERISEWEIWDSNSCGCSSKTITLVVDKQYDLKNINEK